MIQVLENQKIENLDFLFIGGVYPKEIENEILKKSKNGLQMAANNFQWSLIRGFDINLSKPITLLNTIFVGSYPKNYTDCIIYGGPFSHVEGARDFNLGFINFTIIKQFLKPFGEQKILREWLKPENENLTKVVFIYSLSPRTVRLAKQIKKINPKVLVCASVNDLPQNIMLGERGNKKIVKFWKYISKVKIDAGLKYIDAFMVVTKQIAESLNLKRESYVVVEALTEINPELQITANNTNKTKRIVYTGGLAEKYGLLNLLQAFAEIESDDYELLICGDGDCKDKIIEMSKKDSRISYLGVLPFGEVKKIQQFATVLVNPRQNNDDFTRYSFPIKTIDYLLSGTPVIAYKLDGIPADYDEHLIYVEDNTIESLKNKIIQVCNMNEEEYIAIAKKNIRFVVDQKNNIVQTRRILSMFMNNNKK